ncbi:hypothetical protein B0H21DRAFT_127189 [Amylocystis lapponica]|nr:hypothetical protein B0H21DRAFT_127189 [Amylocystis lapponica]
MHVMSVSAAPCRERRCDPRSDRIASIDVKFDQSDSMIHPWPPLGGIIPLPKYTAQESSLVLAQTSSTCGASRGPPNPDTARTPLLQAPSCYKSRPSFVSFFLPRRPLLILFPTMRASSLCSALLALAASVAALPAALEVRTDGAIWANSAHQQLKPTPALEVRTDGAIWAASVHQQVKPTPAAIEVRSDGGIWLNSVHQLVKPTNTAAAGQWPPNSFSRVQLTPYVTAELAARTDGAIWANNVHQAASTA